MKNLINSKSILIPALFIAGSFLVVSCSENKTADSSTDSREVAQQENISKVSSDDKTIVVIENDNDAKFLMDVAEMQLEEISLGKLAQQKGNSPQVKELGKMMEAAHTQTLTEVKALAQSKSVAIPTTVTEDSKDVYQKLNDKTGNDFGKAYSDMMVEHHEDAIKLFEKISTDSEDTEIKAWATQQLPGLRTHLKHAEESKKQSDDMKS
jgi:putative membrane protein